MIPEFIELDGHKLAVPVDHPAFRGSGHPYHRWFYNMIQLQKLRGCGRDMHLAWCTHANATKFKAEAYNLRQENEKLRRELREQGLTMTGRKIEEPKPAFQNIPLPKHTRAVFFVRRQGDASLVAQLLISNSRSFSLEPLPGDEWSFEVKNENMTVLMSQIRVMLAEDVQYRRV